MLDCNFQVSSWAASEIIRGSTVAERAELLEKFIHIADFCRDMNNFNDALLITFSLESISIKRLEKSWRLIPEKVS